MKNFKETNFLMMTTHKNRKVQFNIYSLEYEKHSLNVYTTHIQNPVNSFCRAEEKSLLDLDLLI